jgi:hypothetical protein
MVLGIGWADFHCYSKKAFMIKEDAYCFGAFSMLVWHI